MLGNEYYFDELMECFFFFEGVVDSILFMDLFGMSILLMLFMDQLEGLVVFINVCFIMMEGDEVIVNGIIIVEGNMIKILGVSDQVCVLRNVKVIDCSGKMIMLGIIDVYGYLGDFCYGLSFQ